MSALYARMNPKHVEELLELDQQMAEEMERLETVTQALQVLAKRRAELLENEVRQFEVIEGNGKR